MLTEIPGELERYQQGQCIAIEDLQQLKLSPHRQQLFAKLQAQSTLSLPILAGKQLVGLMVIYQSQVRHWQDWELAFGKQAAQQLGLAIDQIATWTTQSVELRRTNMLSQALQLNEPDEIAQLLDRALGNHPPRIQSRSSDGLWVERAAGRRDRRDGDGARLCLARCSGDESVSTL